MASEAKSGQWFQAIPVKWFQDVTGKCLLAVSGSMDHVPRNLRMRRLPANMMSKRPAPVIPWNPACMMPWLPESVELAERVRA
jgi:hypothetical protein